MVYNSLVDDVAQKSSIRVCCRAALIVLAWIASSLSASAQTDEIQVYDANIEEQGVFNLMIHTNFTPVGRTTPVFPGAIIANDSVNGAAEWAYGVQPWFEQGLYLPVYSFYSKNYGATLNGFKIRELFVRPNARDHTFFFGVNFEFSFNAHYWEDRRWTQEIRPIVGLHLKRLGPHLHRWDLIYNPILDTNYTGGFRNLQFNPAGRVAYNFNETWTVALEEYDGYGPLRSFVSESQQFHESWAVFDHNGHWLNIEAGVGAGLTSGSDALTFKLMLSRDLNSRPEP